MRYKLLTVSLQPSLLFKKMLQVPTSGTDKTPFPKRSNKISESTMVGFPSVTQHLEWGRTRIIIFAPSMAEK
jgi:hypothetical protein